VHCFMNYSGIPFLGSSKIDFSLRSLPLGVKSERFGANSDLPTFKGVMLAEY